MLFPLQLYHTKRDLLHNQHVVFLIFYSSRNSHFAAGFIRGRHWTGWFAAFRSRIYLFTRTTRSHSHNITAPHIAKANGWLVESRRGTAGIWGPSVRRLQSAQSVWINIHRRRRRRRILVERLRTRRDRERVSTRPRLNLILIRSVCFLLG